MRRRNVRAAVLTITAAEAYGLAAKHDGARRVITIPIGVNISEVDVSGGIHSDRKTIVYAGSLGEAYDLMTVLKAFQLIQKHNVAIDLLIIGQAPLAHRLRSASEKMKLENVHFAGPIEPK